MDPSPPRRALGSRYALVEKLGAGAMGEVWRAVDHTTGEHVAAKLLRETYVYDTEIVARFIQERSLLLNLRHPRIVQVRDLVVEGDQLGIVMDLIDGRDLRVHLREVGTVSAREAVAVTCSVLDAIAAAHAANILHRDIKPDNVLLVGGVPGDGSGVRLSDFGIARLAQDSTVQSTGLIGTPGYMPPELFQYGRFSQASDVYAVGVLLYELLGGRTPFAGKGTVHTIGNRHVTVEPPQLPIHPLLWTVIAIMLAKDPSTRLSAAATAQALRDLPAEALDAPPLPRQAEPDTWDTAQRTVVRQQLGAPAAPADAPPGVGTEIKPFAVPGGSHRAEGPAVDDGAGAGPSAGSGAGERASLPPLPAGAGTPGGRRTASRRPSARLAAVVAVLVAAVVLVVVVVALVLPGDGGDRRAEPGGGASDDRASVPAQSVPASTASSPSGLTVTRSAVYEPAARTVELSLGLTYPGRGNGPLEVLAFVPEGAAGGDDGGGQACPDVAWEGVSAAVRVSAVTSGVVEACGWSLTLEAGQGSLAATGTVDVDLGVDATALSTWELEAEQRLQSALGDPRNTTPVFAAQRVSGISLAVQPARLAQGASADVTVAATFPSGDVPVFASGSQPTPALRQLLGTQGAVDVAVAPGCAASLQYTSAQRLYASFATAGCAVEARVGAFTSAPVNVVVTGIDS